MITAVVVHGTGVRREGYEALFGRVEAALGRLGSVNARRCYWGDRASQLNAGGASIPGYQSTRAVTGLDVAMSDEDYEVALWGLLYDDPLTELRALALRRGSDEERPPGQAAPGAALERAARTFVVSPALNARLAEGGIAEVFEEAREAVTGSSAFRDALDAAEGALGDERGAVARACIAQAVAVAAGAGAMPAARVDRRLRDDLEARLIEALGGHERALGGWARGKLGGLVARVGSRYVGRRRGALTDAAYPAAGDILLYQARGSAIAACIRDAIRDAPAPRIVIAHSLGGIACVDLLITQPEPVDLLVTVGSQAPFLYEIGALQSRAYGEGLPDGFPRWLNIYDRRDFLSYIGAGVFDGRVTDVEVDNGVPFPESHSAYWYNPQVWSAIEGALP